MKRYLFIISVIGLIFLANRQCYSQHIPLSTVEKVAQNFYLAHYFDLKDSKKGTSGVTNFHFQKIHSQKTSKGKELYHIFDVKNGGYIIVSALEASYPVLAYSFNNNFPMPVSCPAVTYWMSYYETELAYILNNNISATAKEKQVWNAYKTNSIAGKGFKSVPPLLLTKWNQNQWYNAMSPPDPNGPNGRAYAGCVAVSMAQIMKYYNYPVQGSGSNSYTHATYGNLSADFGNTSYRWHEMPNAINNSNTAIAELLYHCGVAVNMNFGPDGSSADTWTAGNAMKNYFGYHSDAAYRSRYLYSTNGWNNMLKENLDNGIPLIYSGSSSIMGGHAWNCDGYQGQDHFHMNWGWGGSYDGYFFLNDLTPGGSSFNNFQGVLEGLYPGSNYPHYCSGTTTITGISGTFEDGSGPESYPPHSDCYWLIEPSLPVATIKLSFDRFETEDNHDFVTVYDGSSTTSPVLGTFSGATIPPEVTATGGTMLIHFESNGGATFAGFKASYSTSFPVYCSGLTNVTAPHDTVTDGSASNTYNPFTNCRWRIIPPGAEDITLTFLEFDLTTDKDILEIFDMTASPVLLDTYTGNTLPPVRTYNTGRIMLFFKANSDNPGNGFKLFYDATISGIAGIKENNLLNIYPNPVSEQLTIDYYNHSCKELHIHLLNANSQIVFKKTVSLNPATNNISIPVGKFANGIYFIKTFSEKDSSIRKLIINN